MTAALSSFFEALAYNERPMSPDPINIDVEDVVDALTDGRPVSVELEPGDATYYNLIIVPCWAPVVRRSLGRYGVPRADATEYLLVTYLRGDDSPTFFAMSHVNALDVPVKNPWSAGLVAWWLRGLWRAIEADRTQLVRGSYDATEAAAKCATAIVGDLRRPAGRVPEREGDDPSRRGPRAT